MMSLASSRYSRSAPPSTRRRVHVDSGSSGSSASAKWASSTRGRWACSACSVIVCARIVPTTSHLKDEFLATVSHELRTPLNAILGWARMLGAKQLPPVRAEYGIAIIERNASALAHIIDDLLDVSRIVAGTLHLASEPVDLVAVAQAALDAVRPLAVTKDVQLAFSPDLPVIGA